MRYIIQTFTFLLSLMLVSGSTNAADKMDFWQQPQHGGNSFNRLPPNEAYFKALHDYGASWVRLSWDKWPPSRIFLTLFRVTPPKSLSKSANA